jgi:hypothetical protein
MYIRHSGRETEYTVVYMNLKVGGRERSISLEVTREKNRATKVDHYGDSEQPAITGTEGQ